MKKQAILAAFASVSMMPGLLFAKTVALWPLSVDPFTGEVLGQSVINANAADNLSAGGWVLARDQTLGWNLPPNPDTSITHPRFKPIIRQEIYSQNVQAAGGVFGSTAISPELAAALFPTHDLTVEGWARFDMTPGGGTGADEWWVVIIANKGSSSPGGWLLQLRRRDGGKLQWIFYQHKDGSKDEVLGTIDTYGEADYAEKESDFIGHWKHLALTFKYDDPEQTGKSTWTLYVDGLKVGSVSQDTWSGNVSAKALELGGRWSDREHRAPFTSFAYWRVSDACLTPDQFLNAGGAGTLVPVDGSTGSTKMYWKLGKSANGALDTQASVGSVALGGALLGESDNLLSAVSPSADCAFAGNPPNGIVTLPGGNAGSIWQDCPGCFLQASNLGRELTLTNSFTVEGWVRPRRMRTTAANSQFIFNTRLNSNAWACQFCQRDGKGWYLEIYAQDSSGTVVAENARLSADLRDWYDWKHLALVYDMDGGNGNGEWRAYLDGTLAGTAVNKSRPTSDTHSVNFYIGGRPDTVNTFYGNLDCFRVSKAALEPSQFLNATTGAQAATDVLALWPLNTQNGAYFDCADVAGSYTLVTRRDAKNLAVPCDETPVITNPDATPSFLGDPAHANGSTGFRTYGGNNAYLLTTHSDVRDLFTRGDFTIEGYFRRTAAVVDDDWELLFGTTAPEPNAQTFNNIKLYNATMHINFTYRTGGFILAAKDQFNNADVPFPNTVGAMPLNEWQHVALTFSLTNGTATWTLYLNGVNSGSLQSACTGMQKPGSFLVGGRPHSANSFKGAISNVRFSSGVLETSQLLCATNTLPAAVPETLAYWPLDNAAGGIDGTDRLPATYDLGNLLGVSGSDAMAVQSPGKPDASADFQGDPRANAGSVAFADGHANTAFLGDWLDLNTPFTLEGWIRWSHAVTNGLEFLCGTYRHTGVESGWRLCFDTTGSTPRLRVFARGFAPVSTCVDTCFDVDVSFLENAWTHLALTYDNRLGNGTWTLFVDGRELGTVENFWSPNQGTFSHGLFKFGESGDPTTHGFTGLLDMWRVSKGVREPDDFLFLRRRSTCIIFR